MIELFNKLIEVRDISHQIHLSKSETQIKHEALEEFYDRLLELTDDFVEVYQGQYGLVEDFGEFKKVDFSDHLKYFQEFADYVQSKRSDIEEKATHLNTLIDEILLATYKLLYKMKFLK
jgi:hypothetical protein